MRRRTLYLILFTLCLALAVGCASSSRTNKERRYRATLSDVIEAVTESFRDAGLEIEEYSRSARDPSRQWIAGYATGNVSRSGYSGAPVRVASVAAGIHRRPDGAISVRIINEQTGRSYVPGGSDPSEKNAGDEYVRHVLMNLDRRLASAEG